MTLIITEKEREELVERESELIGKVVDISKQISEKTKVFLEIAAKRGDLTDVHAEINELTDLLKEVDKERQEVSNIVHGVSPRYQLVGEFSDGPAKPDSRSVEEVTKEIEDTMFDHVVVQD